MPNKIKRNREAELFLEEHGWIGADEIVDDLINGGFLSEDPMTEPERFAQAARDWVGNMSESNSVFTYASGWSTESWETVLGEKIGDADIPKIKNIFAALVILAKEAGVEL